LALPRDVVACLASIAIYTLIDIILEMDVESELFLIKTDTHDLAESLFVTLLQMSPTDCETGLKWHQKTSPQFMHYLFNDGG
jgi:hypothetical protein